MATRDQQIVKDHKRRLSWLRPLLEKARQRLKLHPSKSAVADVRHRREQIEREERIVKRHGAVSPPNTFPGSPIPGLRAHAPDHETGGLPGYPAHDYMAKPGSPCVSPVTGTVTRLSGHDPALGPPEGPGGPLGWSVYIEGGGKSYFLTHMQTRIVGVGQRVRQGERIGTVANYDKWGRPSHIHQGVHG
jgi:murein DD-endopeptidase MepM/ murein hydrolase activator NlpD